MHLVGVHADRRLRQPLAVPRPAQRAFRITSTANVAERRYLDDAGEAVREAEGLRNQSRTTVSSSVAAGEMPQHALSRHRRHEVFRHHRHRGALAGK
jgi:hypothetical protein